MRMRRRMNKNCLLLASSMDSCIIRVIDPASWVLHVYYDARMYIIAPGQMICMDGHQPKNARAGKE